MQIEEDLFLLNQNLLQKNSHSMLMPEDIPFQQIPPLQHSHSLSIKPAPSINTTMAMLSQSNVANPY
jgi:hypothetical protein